MSKITLIDESTSGDQEKQGESKVRCNECNSNNTVDLYDEDVVFTCGGCDNYFYIPSYPSLSKNQEQSENLEELLEKI